MQTKVTAVLGLGFLLGLGLASCASEHGARKVSSDSLPHYANSREEKQNDLKAQCSLGEERTESGDCVRPHDFDRPFRRGGR